VLHVDGDLVSGESRDIPLLGLRATGLTSLITALERAIEDSHVRAIVVRIESPGGSFLAADLLARELDRARQHKPVVCSLGDTAASGGYYIAAGCDEIFAAPATLTGSIGIYTGKIDFSGLLAKLGVSLTRIERGAHAGMDSPFRKYTDEERASIMQLLQHHYGRFVQTVARGRHMSTAQVEALGEGRIFSGDRARAVGLVDHFGGLQEAIESAARRAGVPSTTAIEISPAPPTILGQLGQILGLPKRNTDSTRSALPTVDDLLQLLPSSLVFEPSVPQARLEADLP